MTTSQQEFIDGKINGVPITYERKSTPKEVICNENLWKSDLRIFGSKIGIITNYGTTFYGMMGKSSIKEYEKEILNNRLKIACSYQSMQIDNGKGIDVMPIPKFWGDWSKIKDEDAPDIVEQKKQNNRLVCNQRPYFFRYVYKHQNNSYLRHLEKYQEYADNNNSTLRNLGDDKVQHYFERYSPLFDSDSVMNNLCRYMESKIKELKEYKTDFGWNFNVDKIGLEKVRSLYREWKNAKSTLIKDDDYDVETMIIEFRRKADEFKIRDTELAKMALNINSSFAFTVFGNDVVKLFKQKEIEVPVLAKDGDMEFLGEIYKLKVIEL